MSMNFEIQHGISLKYNKKRFLAFGGRSSKLLLKDNNNVNTGSLKSWTIQDY